MFFVGFKAPSFLHIFAIRKMKSRTPEPELFMSKNVIHSIGDLVFSNLIVFILLCRINYGFQKKMSCV